MNVVLMKTKSDCEIAAIATACSVSYDRAKKAIAWKDLPGELENPIYGNPENLYLALIKLGFWKKNIVLSDLLSGKATPGKTIVLIHKPTNPISQQHWVVWAGKNDKGKHLFYWGDSEKPVTVSEKSLSDYYCKGWPNCAFEVYKASIWQLLWQKFLRLFE
ncbi:MAG: hypothetical protein HQM10_05055 [Candidatus Riflebacteria bacterium]|nr:hypothetical protein [Candidatus Riflebacteria bacterium]